MKKQTSRSLLRVVTLVLVGITAFAAQAAPFIWTGTAGNGLWTDEDNWDVGTGYPGAGDDVEFPDGAVYTFGVQLNGNQTCNSITISGGVGFTLGPAGDTLTVESGSISRNYNTTAQHIIATDLQLNAPTGTNTIEVTHGEAWNVPNRRLVLTGTVTSTGSLRKIGNAGKLTLSNGGSSFGGGPRIEGGVLEVDGITVGSIFTADDIVLHNAGALYVRNLSQTITNAFAVTGSSGTPRIVTYDCGVTLAGDIDIPVGRTLQLGNTHSHLIVFDNQVTGEGNIAINRSGTAMNSTNQFVGGNLHVGSGGGAVIMDTLDWNAFTNHFHNGYGTGARQWQVGGNGAIGARGTPFVISGTGTVGGGADAQTWFDAGRGFGPVRHSAGNFSAPLSYDYADSRVELHVDTQLTGRRTWYSAGPGQPLTGTHDETRVHRVEGNITDQVAAETGAARGTLTATGPYQNGELVLAGTNDWTGSICASGLDGASWSVNTGRGGMHVDAGAGALMLARFDGNESLPRGNGGTNTWLLAMTRHASTVGYLLTGKPGDELYTLKPGYRFLLGNRFAQTIGVLGSSGDAGTAATLNGCLVGLHARQEADAGILYLLVRGPSAFVMGQNSAPVRLTPTYGMEASDNDTGIDGTATVVQDATGARTIFKRGDGTAVLRNVAYVQLDGTTDATSQFTLQLGRDAGNNQGTGAYFDGAVRGLADDNPLAGSSNSLNHIHIGLRGSVYEVDGAGAASSFTRDLGAGVDQVNWGAGGGGFSAYDGDLTVNIGGAAAQLTWAVGGFVPNNQSLILGSGTATHVTELQNPVSLVNSLREIRVIDNPVSDGDWAVISGQIISTGTSGGFNKAGDGTLDLAHANNTFTGPVNINGGTLIVSGAISNGTATVTVNDGAGLGGTGTIVRPVSVQSGGILAPGDLGIGTLTIANNLTLAEGAVYELEYNGSSADRIEVSGTLTLPATGTVAIAEGSPKAAGRIVLIDAAASAGATDLSGWTVTGVSAPDEYSIERVGDQLVFVPPPIGTLILIF